NRSADGCEFMAIELQYEATDYDETHARICCKRVGVNESRSDIATRNRIFKPSQGKNTVGRVGATDRSNGPRQQVCPRGVAEELNGNPEDACSRDQFQKRQACQFAIDTDAAFNRPLQRIRSHLPYGMMQPAWGPRRILNQNPEHDSGKQRGRGFDLLDRHGMAFASYQQRELVDCNEARKQNSINPPREHSMAATPKWTPRQPGDERPHEDALYDGAFRPGAYVSSRPRASTQPRGTGPRGREPATRHRLSQSQ